MTPTVILLGAEEARTVGAKLAKARVIFLKVGMTIDLARLR
jgi:hypothetical protein